MSAIPGTILSSRISPGNTTSTFPTHVDIYGQGGLMCFSTFASLTAQYGLPEDRQKIGMILYVQETGSYYTLTSIGPLSSGNYTGFNISLTNALTANSLYINGPVFAQSFIPIQPSLLVFDTVAVSALPNTVLSLSGNDVELYTTQNVIISSFNNVVKGALYTLTNQSTAVITISSSPFVYVRNGTSWSSNTFSLTGSYLDLLPNMSCSLRGNSGNVVSVW
jgi:hypothetical protein